MKAFCASVKVGHNVVRNCSSKQLAARLLPRKIGFCWLRLQVPGWWCVGEDPPREGTNDSCVVRVSGCPVSGDRCPVSSVLCPVTGVWCVVSAESRESGVCRLASAVWRPVSAAYNFIDRHELHQNRSFTKQISTSSAKTFSKYSCIKFRKGHLLRNFIKQTTLSTCLMTCSLRSLARFARLSGNGASCGHRKSSVEHVVCFLSLSRGGCMDHFLFASRVLI